MLDYAHCEVLLTTVVWLVNNGRGLGWLASQMTVPTENYVKDFVPRNSVFIIRLIIPFSFFVYKNISIVSIHELFLA